MDPREAFDLLAERRLCGARSATKRPLERAPEVGQGRLRLTRAAAPGLGREIAVSVQRHRDAEQPLNDSLVDFARQIDPLLELAGALGLGGDDPRDRCERGRLAETPPQG